MESPTNNASHTCVFCRIIRGELPSSRILEDSITSAFLDLAPVNQGHTLVVPLRHVVSFTDLTTAEVASMGRIARQVAAALKATVPSCEGVTLSMADGAVAGQEVGHAHMHVIPRHRGDGFGWRRHGGATARPQLDELVCQIRSATSH
jgi:histidine triad (HIT) family protein